MADINIDSEAADLYDDLLSPNLRESDVLQENFLSTDDSVSIHETVEARSGSNSNRVMPAIFSDSDDSPPTTSSLQYNNGSDGDPNRTNNAIEKGEIDLQGVEFSFLDNKNVCCGICGEIVPYDTLMIDHLPSAHPTIMNSSIEEWLQKKLKADKRAIEAGFKMTSFQSAARAPRRQRKLSPAHRAHLRIKPHQQQQQQRVVSTIRVNPREMSLAQLDQALRKKMFEKLRRHAPVSLIDKLHARCGFCNAIISLNKKFEIVHLVRHFNCWHPTVHHCAGTWRRKKSGSDKAELSKFGPKPLTVHDFVVIDAGQSGIVSDAVQCIWCGLFVEAVGLAQHFAEVHADEVEVPKCQLCMHELIVNARLQERYSADFLITLPDEHRLMCGLCSMVFTTEVTLERHVIKRHVEGGVSTNEAESEDEMLVRDELGPEAFANSRMIFGKRRRPKRQFIMPSLRQAVPLDSGFIEPISDCHWKCKACTKDIYGAVISAAAIKHYKIGHPDLLDSMQLELCKARLEKVSDGCMEFINSMLIECLLCQQHFNLHQPFNMCRAIRHLKVKHANLMPEYAGMTSREERDFQHSEAAFLAESAYLGHLAAAYQGPKETLGVDSNAFSTDFHRINVAPGDSGLRGSTVFVQQQQYTGMHDRDPDHGSYHSGIRSAVANEDFSVGPQTDHLASGVTSSLPTDFDDFLEPDRDGQLSESFLEPTDDQRPVYILVADEAQRQKIVEQVLAAGGKIQTA